MKKQLGMVLICAMVLGCHSAFAMTGDDLVEGMRSYLKAEKDYTRADYLLSGNYMGYVLGVAEATASDYSLPSGVTPERLYQIVAVYLEKHPKRWNEPAANLVRGALGEAFPKYLIRNK